MCSLTICMSLEKFIQIFCPLFNWVVWVFSMLEFMSPLYVLGINPLSTSYQFYKWLIYCVYSVFAFTIETFPFVLFTFLAAVFSILFNEAPLAFFVEVGWWCQRLLAPCCSVAKLRLTLCDPVYTGLPCPSPSSRVCPSSCLLNRWCRHIISPSAAPLLLLSILPNIRVFSNELAVCIREPKYLSFRISFSSLFVLKNFNFSLKSERWCWWVDFFVCRFSISSL